MATNVRGEHLAALRIEAEENDLDPKLVDAIIHCESSWNPWAVRYERNFTYLENPEKYAKQNRITLATEQVLQKCSFGLMQVMGGTARWLGYIGPLTALLDPEVGIHIGCRYLAHLSGQYLKTEDKIAAYNAGSVRRRPDGTYMNQVYVDKVMAIFKTL